MNTRKLILLLALILFLPAVFSFHPVQAAGLAYVSPAITNDQPVGSTFSIQIKVANMDPFNTYDVVVTADQSVVNPTSLSTNQNIFFANTTGGTPFEFIHCVNGVGQGCQTSTLIDGPGVVHSAFTDLGYGITASGGGLLFTINYTVVSSKTYAPLIIQSAIIAVSGHAIAHTTANGQYGAPDFSVSSSLSSLGPLAAASGQTASSTITVAGMNGYTGTVSVSVPSSGLTTSLDLTSCSLSPSVTSCSGTFTVTAANIHGPFNVIIDGNDGVTDHQAVVVVHVSDFSVDANPTVVGPQNPGVTGSGAIIVKAFDGFTGSVGLVLTGSSSHITSSVSVNPVNFTSGGATTLSSTLSVSFDELATYTVLVTGQSSGYPSHSVLVTVLSPPTVLVAPRGQLLTSNGSTVVYSVNAVSMPPFAAYDIMVVTNPALLSPDSIDTSASVLSPGSEFTNCVNNGFHADGTPIPLGSPGNLNCGTGDGPGVAHSGFASSGEFSGDGLLFTVTYKPSTLDFSIGANTPTVTFAGGQTGSSTINIALSTPTSTAVRVSNDFVFDANGNTIDHNTLNGNYGSVATMTLKPSPSSVGVKSTVDMRLLIFAGPRTTASSTLSLTAKAAGSFTVTVTATLQYTNSSGLIVKVVHSTPINVVVT